MTFEHLAHTAECDIRQLLNANHVLGPRGPGPSVPEVKMVRDVQESEGKIESQAGGPKERFLQHERAVVFRSAVAKRPREAQATIGASTRLVERGR